MFGGVEEGHGVLRWGLVLWGGEGVLGGLTYLEEEAEGYAGVEGVVGDHGAEECGTAGLGIVGTEASVKGFWE